MRLSRECVDELMIEIKRVADKHNLVMENFRVPQEWLVGELTLMFVLKEKGDKNKDEKVEGINNTRRAKDKYTSKQ